MDFGERQVLESFVASHGRPDTPGTTSEPADTAIHFEYDYEKGIVKGGPLGARIFETHLEEDGLVDQKNRMPDAG
jgi:hypothetical protein